MNPERFYKQPLTYWSIASRDEFGKITFGSPQNFNGRWEDKTVDVMNTKGEVFQSRAQIYVPLSITVQEDGWMYQGTSTATDPTQLAGAYRVKTTQKVPDLRSITSVQIAVL